MLIIIASLISIVAFLAYARPEALKGIRPELQKNTLEQSPEQTKLNRYKINQVYFSSTSGVNPIGIERDEAILKNHFKKIIFRHNIDFETFRKDLCGRRQNTTGLPVDE